MVHQSSRSPSWMSRNVERAKWLIPILAVGTRGNHHQHLYSCGPIILTVQTTAIKSTCINYRETVVQYRPTRSLRLPDWSLFAKLRDTLYPLVRVGRCARSVDPEYARIPLYHRHSSG